MPGVLLLWLSLPILPVRVLASVPIQNLNYDMGENVGWPELVAQVAGVRDQLPDAERAGAVVLTSNYGEAGAIDRYGSAFGLPTSYSGHNTYWWWGPPVAHGGPNAVTMAVGFDRSQLTPYFGDVRLAATVHNDAGVANDEEGAPIWVCTGQHEPWSLIWSQFRHYG